jgi:hypothetical protein
MSLEKIDVEEMDAKVRFIGMSIFRARFWKNCFFHFHLLTCCASQGKVEWSSVGSISVF